MLRQAKTRFSIRSKSIKYSSNSILKSVPLLLILLASYPVRGEIVPDTTLPANSIATPNGNTIAIEGGTEVGDNLFHSFETFSLPTGNEAFFDNALAIDNIITRVTGGQISSIDGLIRTNGTANLFLMNPNGIHFGENARLEVGGSFLASTADRLLFEDGSVFDALNPNRPPLLTVSVPIGVQFGDRGGDNPGGITNLGNLTATGDLTLSGSHVTNTGRLSSDRGNIAIEAVAGDVQIENATAGGIALSASGNAIVGNLDTRDVSGGGNIGIDAGENILINGNLDASANFISIVPTLSFEGDGGNITLTAGGDISFVPGTSFVLSLGLRGGNISFESGGALVIEDAFIGNLTTGNMRGGDISLAGDSILLRNFGRVVTLTLNEGRGGDISVTAAGTIDFVSELESSNLDRNNLFVNKNFLGDAVFRATGISTSTISTGRGGDITLQGSQLSIRNESPFRSDAEIPTPIGVGTTAEDRGNSGNIRIEMSESVEIVGNTPGAFVPVLDENGADIVIGVPTGLTSDTNSRGISGSLTINTERLTIRDGVIVGLGTSPVSQESDGGNLNGGTLTVNATQLELRGLAGLISATRGTENAGNLVVNADAIALRDGAFISADTVSSGNAGNLTIDTRTLTLTNGSRIGAASIAEGRGSTVNISATESIDLIGTSADGRVPSGLFADSQGSGEAGTLRVTTGQLRVRDEASITVSSRGEAPRAGNLEIAVDTLQLENGAKIDAQTNAGDGGDINLQVEDFLLLRQESNISTTAGTDEAGGNGGNIDLDTDFIVALPNEDSNITANAFAGDGGRVNIAAQSVFGIEFREVETPFSDITASSQFGQQGVVRFEIPDLDPVSELANLPENTVDVEELSGNPCDRSLGKFIVTGRGGLPPTPRESLSYQESWVDLVELPSDLPGNSDRLALQPQPQSDRLVEAQGWKMGDNGEVILTTHPPTVNPHGTSPIPDSPMETLRERITCNDRIRNRI